MDGSLDPARLARWRKLQAEDAFSSDSLAERRGKDRAFGTLVRSAMKARTVRKRWTLSTFTRLLPHHSTVAQHLHDRRSLREQDELLCRPRQGNPGWVCPWRT